jgi:RNA polymerase sigma-70 factor, ECF subfamily
MNPERDRAAAHYARGLRVLQEAQAAAVDDGPERADATQEVFLRLVHHLSRFEDRAEVLPWIFRVARNHCLNVRRDARHLVLLADEPLAPEGAEGGGVDHTRTLLARALLGRFDVSTQRVVLGVFAAGMTYEDAAAALGLSRTTVARKVERFLSKARAFLTLSDYALARGGRADARARARSPRARRRLLRTSVPATPRTSRRC